MSFEDEVNFCINFLKSQDSFGKSCIFSPISMLSSLAMICAGSDGNTADEIVNIVGKGKNKEDIMNYYSNFIKRHKNDQVDDADNAFKLVGTYQLFIDKKIEIVNLYNEIIKEKFDANFHTVNFTKGKDDPVKVINKFVNDATNERIKEICGVDDIIDDTEIIFISATSFIGRWFAPFEAREKTIFHSKIPREIFSMNTDMFCNYNEGEDWKCVGIPYQGRKTWMFLLVPNEKDGLQNLINKMNNSLFMECINKSDIRYIDLTIPVFEISENYNLAKRFKNLGINDLSHRSNCNLSKMIKNNYFVNIEKVFHKAVINIDEYGTEVSAIRRQDRLPACMTKEFTVNHPFMFFIVSADRDSDEDDENFLEEGQPTEILFAGTFC